MLPMPESSSLNNNYNLTYHNVLFLEGDEDQLAMAGLLTCCLVSNVFPKNVSDLCLNREGQFTAAGLSGIHTSFPFNHMKVNQCECKGIIF